MRSMMDLGSSSPSISATSRFAPIIVQKSYLSPVSSLYPAFSGGFLLRSDLKLRHSEPVGIEVRSLCFQLLVLRKGGI